MNKIKLAIIAFVLTLAPVQTASAVDFINYGVCVKASNGYPFKYARVDIGLEHTQYLDASGCSVIPLSTAADSHSIRFVGSTGFKDEPSNFLTYEMSFDTGKLLEDTTLNVVIPVSENSIEVKSVDGQPVVNPSLSLRYSANYTLPNIGESGLFVKGGFNNDYIDHRDELGRFNLITLSGMQLPINVQASEPVGLEVLQTLIDPSTQNGVYSAILQYPAPEPPEIGDIYIDSLQRGRLNWIPTSNATGARIIRRNVISNQQITFDVPYPQTSYIDELPSQEGQYTYNFQSYNQFGYSGNSYRSASVWLDSTAPVNDALQLTPSIRTKNKTSTLSVLYHDNESYVESIEYFLNTDPGAGNGTSVPQNSNGSHTAMLGTNIPKGQHQVGIRAKNYAGKWSQPVYITLSVR